MSDNIFADEWRDCLRAHFINVVREDDRSTLSTLENVMYEVGFNDAELQELRRYATMRTEDMPDDYVPQEVIDQYESQLTQGVEIEPEEDAPDVLPEEALAALAVNEEVVEPEPEKIEAVQLIDEAEDAPDDDLDPDAPQQMSLF